MAISAADVKNLREMTGAGMMACKEALKETDGDLEKAVDYLRKKGLAAAKKKQGRIAAEGAVVALSKGPRGVVVEVNCETDFVSKGDDFKAFANKIADHVMANSPTSLEELLSQKLEGTQGSISDACSELTLKCGEKVEVRRFETVTLDGTGSIGSYNHGGKIGVLVSVSSDKALGENEVFEELTKDLSMHVAAADPRFLLETDIDQDFKDREAAIYSDQLKEQGKPENMIAKIVEGKLKKLASEVCLLEQKFIKDSDMAIKDLLEQKAKELGATLAIKEFKKLNLGEGIEKKVDNLADEVAKMTQKQ